MAKERIFGEMVRVDKTILNKWVLRGKTIGRKFEGQFVNGRKEGEGRFFGTDLSKYVGEFSRDRLEGFGVMEMPDGHIYTGHFANWTRFGRGNLTYRNGDFFEVNYYCLAFLSLPI